MKLLHTDQSFFKHTLVTNKSVITYILLIIIYNLFIFLNFTIFDVDSTAII